MRRNEVLALRWRDIRPDELIHITRQFLGDSATISAPKCQKMRMSEIPSRVLEALAFWRESTAFQADDDLLFCNSSGYRKGNKWWSYHFHFAVRAIGLDPSKRCLKPHSFRHTLNTRLRASGKLSDKKIRDALGWSAQAIQDGYTHQDRDAVVGIGLKENFVSKVTPNGDVVVSVRLAPELIEWIDHHADANLRNHTQEIEYLVRLGLAEVQEQEKTGRQDLSLPTLNQIRELVEKIKSKKQ